MGERIRSDALRRMVAEWIEKGCAVVIKPDGEIVVTPPAQAAGKDPDFIDWRRK